MQTRLFIAPILEKSFPFLEKTSAQALKDDENLGYLLFALFLIPIGFCLIYMRITKPESLKVFRKGSLSERFLSLFAGLAIGFITNGALSLLAGLTGSVKITFHCFTPYMVLILPFCFIQCTCEEVLLRGYVPQYMEDRHDWSSVAFVSGALWDAMPARHV